MGKGTRLGRPWQGGEKKTLGIKDAGNATRMFVGDEFVCAQALTHTHTQ